MWGKVRWASFLGGTEVGAFWLQLLVCKRTAIASWYYLHSEC